MQTVSGFGDKVGCGGIISFDYLNSYIPMEKL